MDLTVKSNKVYKALSEHSSHMPRRLFVWRLLRNSVIGVTIILVSLGLGMLGYHHFESMSWIDAYINAAMILSGMGPVATEMTDKGKIFAGTYALFSGVIFLVTIGIVIAPIIHWFFIKFRMVDPNLK